MVTGYELPDAADSAAELRDGFEWHIPDTYNIAEEVSLWAEDSGSRAALFHVDDAGTAHEFSYSELLAASERVAATLEADGISMGDRLALCGSQSPETLIVHLAAYRLGAVVVPISVLFGADTFTHVLETSTASQLWLDTVAADEFDAELDALEAVSTTVFELDTAYQGDLRALGGLAEHTDGGMVETFAKTGSADPALFVSTSGTSGTPKCVVQSHLYLLGTLPGYQLWYEIFGEQHRERVWTPASWAWAGALFDVVFPTLAMGGTVCSRVRRTGFDPDTSLSYLERAGVTRLFLPPTALRKIRTAGTPADYDLSTLRVMLSGGEFLADELRQWGEEVLGVRINDGYGLTEANALIGNCQAIYPTRGTSIGIPYPGHDIEIVDEDGTPVPTGETGEIALDAPDPVLFCGYWRDGALTDSPEDGLFLLGDRGSQDKDGYVYYEGRSDSVIISSGYRVSPKEIEDALEADETVQEAVVGGVPDDEVGERIVAYVVPGTGAAIDSEALIQNVRATLGAYKSPHEIHELRDPPQTHSGKIDRTALFSE